MDRVNRGKSALKIVVAILAATFVLGVSAADGSPVSNHARLSTAQQARTERAAAALARIGMFSLGSGYLTPRGVGVVGFGLPYSASVVGLQLELGYTYVPTQRSLGRCGASVIAWPVLSAFYRHNRFAGYLYHPAARFARLETGRGLKIGDPLETGRFLYGNSFNWDTNGGRRWSLRLSGGYLFGEAVGSWGRNGSVTASSSIVSIGAGAQGCG